MIDGKLTPSSLINVAVREWLGDNGHAQNLYVEMTDQDDEEFAA